MIFLKIREKGHFIQIPGLPPFRTPVKANITHISIGMVVSTLKAQGIRKFEIVSDIPGKEQVLTQDDFKDKVAKKEKSPTKEDKLNKKLSRLEKMFAEFLSKNTVESKTDSEQITKRLDSIESLIISRSLESSPSKVDEIQDGDDPIIEELETFIPDVDIGGMRMSGESVEETIKEDDDTDEAADLLSSYIKKK